MPETIDEILMRRAAPKAPDDLAERIIMRARSVQRTRGFDLHEFRVLLQGIFLSPQPALALAVIAILGLYIGSDFESYFDTGVTTQDLAGALEVIDPFDAGEWL